jgi:hypothetical protein
MTEQDEARLQKVLRSLTPTQLRWVAARPHCNSDAEAALEAGIDPSAVWRWPQRVHTAVRLMAGDGVIASREILRTALPLAAMRKVDALNSGDERIQQAAATEILDRFHGKPKQSIDAVVSGPVSIVMTWGDNDAGDGDAAEAA